MTRAESLLKIFLDQEDITAPRTAAGIENHRKGFIDLKVVDTDGRPVPGAAVELNQTSHDFFFGANLFMLDEFESEEKNTEYRRMFAETFNMATLPFYWDTLEPEEGKPRFGKDSPRVYRRPTPDLCLEYCEEKGITPKAHCLHYDHFQPKWLDKYSAPQQWEKLERRIRECAEHYKDRIHGWEVTNELWWTTETTQMYRDPLYMEKSFQLARRYFPVNELIANEGGEPFRSFFQYNRNSYFMQLERALLKGAQIDTVGFQYHLWCTPETEVAIMKRQFDADNMYRVFDTFATLNKPFQMTELTFPCHDPESREAEDLQAEILRRLYTIWFGVPNMEAIIYWNLVDGYAHGATPGDFTNGENKLAGGLAHFDMSPKPALTELNRLVKKEWHSAGTVTTNEGGMARFKGFFGQYDAKITVDGRTVPAQIHLAKRQTSTYTVTLNV